MKKENKIIYSLIFIVALVVTTFFTFAGCLQTYNGFGKFKDDELVLAVGDTVDATQLIESNYDLDFIADNTNILVEQENNQFYAKTSGETALVAKYKDSLIDVIKVKVKYKFSSPNNITMSNDGLIQWQHSVVTENQNESKASYTISLTKDGKTSEHKTTSNNYQLEESGVYIVKVKANETDEILASDYSAEKTFTFALTDMPGNFYFVPSQTFGSQSGTLSWNGVYDSYDLIIDKIYQTDITSNFVNLDFSNFYEGQICQVGLVAYKENNASKTLGLEIEKISTPSLTVVNDELSWSADENISKYIISYKNSSSSGIITEQGTTSILEGIEEGVYQISGQAFGKNNFANGDVKTYNKVAKISNVSYSFEIEGSTLIVTFYTEEENNKQFIVTQNDKEYLLEFTGEKVNGKYTLTQSFSLVDEVSKFYLQALPTFVNGKIEINGETANYAVKSDKELFVTCYKMQEIKNLTHNVLDNGTSVLVFDEIANANDVRVTINDVEVQNVSFENKNGKTTVNIGTISSELYGNNGLIYNIKLSVTRKKVSNEVTTVSQATKTLVRLSAPSLANLEGAVAQQNIYTWEQQENARFSYLLYSTDSDYDISGIQPYSAEVDNPTIKNIKAGYYVLQVKSIPENNDKYLASETYSQDYFYAQENIASPQLSLDYDDSKLEYKLTILTSEFGYKYEIFLNDEKLGEVYDEQTAGNDRLTFYLGKDITFDIGNSFVLKVTVSAEEQEQNIHLSSSSQLQIERQNAPSKHYVANDGDKLIVENENPNARILLKKDGQTLVTGQAGEDVEVFLGDYDGEFSIYAQYLTYQSFSQTTSNGSIMLESIASKIEFYRSATPTNLNYQAGEISFSHQTKSEEENNYTVYVTVTSANGSSSSSFAVNATSFNLEDQIEAIRENDAIFNSHFEQRVTINISVKSIVNEKIQEVYFLPSRMAKTLYGNNEILTIQQLNAVELNYDDSRRVISWAAIEGDNVFYDLYYCSPSSESPICVETLNSATLRTFTFSINEFDFSEVGDHIFYVIARSDNAYNSNPSGQIIVHKISTVSSLNIESRDGKYYASFTLPNQELDNIKEILVNGNSIGEDPLFVLSTVGEGQQAPSIDENGLTSVQVVGKAFQDGKNKTFYISSNVTLFNFQEIEIGDYVANAVVENNKISWNDFEQQTNDWALTEPTSKNIKYEIRIITSQGSVRATISNISSTYLSLDDEILLGLETESYSIQILAYVGSYKVFSGGKGYFGSTVISESIELSRLNPVQNLQATISQAQVDIEQELAKKVELSWDYEDKENVVYKIYVNGNYVGETQNKAYQLAQSFFNTGSNTIDIIATNTVEIQSTKTQIQIYKFSSPEIYVSDGGLLTINSPDIEISASLGYIIELQIDGEKHTHYASSTTVDLQEYINGKSGQYTLKVLTRATQKVAVTQYSPTVKQGTILEIPKITQDEAGLQIQSNNQGVVYFVVCKQKDYFKMLDGNYFAFPDDWLKEESPFTVLVYSTKLGCIDSWKGTQAENQIELDRIDSVSSVTFTRDADFNDQTLSWEAIKYATGYSIEIYQNEILIFAKKDIKTNSIKLSLLEDEYGATLPSGDLIFKVRALTSFVDFSKTNSLPLIFEVRKLENTTSNIRAVDDDINTGFLTFDSEFNGQGTHIVATDVSGTSKSLLLEGEQNQIRIEEIFGEIQVTARVLATLQDKMVQTSNETVLLDSDLVAQSIYKVRNISNITADFTDGSIIISLQQDLTISEDLTPYRFFVEHEQQRFEIEPVKTADNTYKVLAPEIANLYDIEDGEFSFAVSVCCQGKLLSNDYDFAFEFKNANLSLKTVKGTDERQDYIIVTEQDGALPNITAFILKDLENNFYTVPLNLGYWYSQSGDVGEILGQYVEGAVECYYINVGETLANFVSGTKNLQVAYITNENDTFVLTGYCQALTYTKLVAPNSISISQGDLIWDAGMAPRSSFYLYFENTTHYQEIKIADPNANYYLGEELDIQLTSPFKVAIQNASNEKQVLSSIKTYIGAEEPQDIYKNLINTQNIIVENGSIKFNFTGQDSSLASDLDKITTATINTSEAVRALLSTNRNDDFSFALSDLANIEFNLRFTSAERTYTTTVSAVNLITGLNTTLTGYSGTLYGRTITEAVAHILTFQTLPTTSSARKTLEAVYSLLTTPSYWTGVATAELLFDEMGASLNGADGRVPAEKIQPGVYDVFIQQKGSEQASSISSNYLLIKSGLEVQTSTMTKIAQDDNLFYLDFRPTTDKNYYTMALSHEENGVKLVEKISIKYEDGVWYRTEVNGFNYTKILEVVDYDSVSFVRIPLNDSNGIYLELSGGDGPERATYYANIYINGDDTSLNGKTEEVRITFLEFDLDSLKLNNGKFEWNSFTVANTTFPGTVRYKYSIEAIARSISPTVVGGIQAFSPTAEGQYDYFEFYTPGAKSNYAVSVSSEIYRLYNVYKLSAPQVTTENGELIFSDSLNEINDMNRTFAISNNASGSLSLNIISDTNTITHTPGVNGMTSQQGNEYNYRLTENQATTFYGKLVGDNITSIGSFQKGIITDEKYNCFEIDTPITDRDTIYLTSESVGIYAKMIDTQSTTQFNELNQNVTLSQNVALLNGKVIWQKIEDAELVQETNEILYEVKVETYYFTGSSWTLDGECSRTYYTSNNYISADYFVNSPADNQKFAIYIRPNIFELNSNGEIESLEGKKYSISHEGVYKDNTSMFVLNGERIVSYINDSDLFEKTASVTGLAVVSGQLTWNHNAEQTDHERFDVEYSIAGRNEWNKLDGFAERVGISNSFVFNITSGQLSSSNSYNFRVYAVNVAQDSNGDLAVGGMLRSDGTYLGGQNLQNVNVLRDMLPENFTTERLAGGGQDSDYSVNFANYYEYYNSFGTTVTNNINLKVDIISQNESGEEEILNTIYVQGTGNKTCVIQSEYVSQNGQVVIEVTPISNMTYYLNAQNIARFTLSETSWSNADKVYFDQNSQTFSWTYGAKYQYEAMGEGQVAVYYNDPFASAFRVYGALPDEEVSSPAKITKEGIPMLPAILNDETVWISANDVRYSFLEDSGAVLIVINPTQVYSYDETSDEFNVIMQESTGSETDETQLLPIIISENTELVFGQSYFEIEKQILDDSSLTKYFVPLNCVKQTEANIFVISDYTQLYLDSSFEHIRGIESHTVLNVSNYVTADNGYYQIKNYGDENFYLKAENVNKTIICDENINTENILFKVTIVSEKVEVVGNNQITTKTTREYDDIELGSIDPQTNLYTTYFEPNLIGDIISFSVQAKRGQNNLLSYQLEYLDGNAQFNLFSSGDGSKTNPYVIDSEEQFMDVGYRSQKQNYHTNYNQSQTVTTKNIATGSSTTKTSSAVIQDADTSYNFIQNADLSFANVEGFIIKNDFSGNYDGNDFDISVSIEKVSKLDNAISWSNITSSSTTVQNFEYGAGLFKKIKETATVSNVNLSVTVNYTEDLKESSKTDSSLASSIVSGLALTNNGTIENVQLKTLSVNFETTISSSLQTPYFAVSGIVAENNSKLTDCYSSANIQISQKNSPTTQYFICSPIAFLNNAQGVMFNCRNIGNININWNTSSNDNSVLRLAGVLISNNFGTVENCYNTATLTNNASCNTYTAGVVLLSNGGKLYSCANAGSITSKYAGGIAYKLQNITGYNLVALGRVNNGSANLLTATGNVNNATVYSYVAQGYGSVYQRVNADMEVNCFNSAWKIVISYATQVSHSINYQKV